MSTETETKKPTVTNWALLHELVLRANTAKDFKTLGEAMEVLSGIMSEFPPYFGDGCAQSYFQSACSKAAKYMADKLFAWLENPPPIAPQETQIAPSQDTKTGPIIMFSASDLHALITRCTWSSPVDPDVLWAEMRETVRARWGRALGELNAVYRAMLTPQIGPGNPFPPPPPPPPTVAGENTNAMLQEYISIDELKERVQDVLRPFVVSIRDARMINGDFARQSMNLISERIDGVFSNVDAKPPTVAPGGWTGALVFERIAPKGLTNPVGYPAATPDEQAELDRMARAINRNTPLFEPTPQAPGSLDALRKTIVCAITNEKEAVNGQYGGADVGLLLNALVRMVDKAFADYAAQNAKAIERAAEPAKTLEPWTVDRLKLIFDEHDTIFDLDDDVADLIVSIFNDENKKSGKAMGHSTHAAEFPKPWTGEELYLAAKIKVRAIDAAGDYSALTNEQQVLWMLGAAAANARMGVCSQ